MSVRFLILAVGLVFAANSASAQAPLPKVDTAKLIPLPAAEVKLVSLVVKEKPFNEVIDKLAEMYDLSVVICPQSGDGRTGFVTARLKNVTPAVAIELLAVQCDLRVIRKGNAFLITSRDHANELHNEKFERERQKIELLKFREAPLPKPQPEPKPEPKAEPKTDK